MTITDCNLDMRFHFQGRAGEGFGAFLKSTADCLNFLKDSRSEAINHKTVKHAEFQFSPLILR